jgi:L-aspartate semialdehyde sulfurtransferase
VPKTYAEINEKIRAGKAVVVTAEEMIGIVEEDGVAKAAQKVDVVTTGTFGPMCSTGAFLNIGHTTPRMKLTKAWINGVSAYSGLAAVDLYIGVTESQEDDPLNTTHPGAFRYGGGHVIEDLIAKDDVRLVAEAYGTDCYPRKKLDTWLNIKDLNQAYLCSPRNCYQNYGVAVNAGTERDIYTYMGVLRRNFGSASYCSAGQLSPLLNDPYYRTIAQPAPQRPLLPHHRHRHPHLPGRRAGPRLLGGHPALPHRRPRRQRRPQGWRRNPRRRG